MLAVPIGLCVFFTLATVFFLPIYWQRKLAAYRHHPNYASWQKPCVFSMGDYRGLFALAEFCTIFIPFFAPLIAGLVGAGFAAMLFTFAYKAERLNAWTGPDTNDNFEKALESARRYGPLVGWWIGKGRPPQFICLTLSPKSSVERMAGCLFYSGIATRHLEVAGKDNCSLNAFVELQATATAPADGFLAQCQAASKTIEDSMKRLVDEGVSTKEIRQHLLMLQDGSLGGVAPHFVSVGLTQTEKVI